MAPKFVLVFSNTPEPSIVSGALGPGPLPGAGGLRVFNTLETTLAKTMYRFNYRAKTHPLALSTPPGPATTTGRFTQPHDSRGNLAAAS